MFKVVPNITRICKVIAFLTFHFLNLFGYGFHSVICYSVVVLPDHHFENINEFAGRVIGKVKILVEA